MWFISIIGSTTCNSMWNVMNVEKQSGVHDYGLYAIGFCTALAYKLEPCVSTLIKMKWDHILFLALRVEIWCHFLQYINLKSNICCTVIIQKCPKCQ